MRDLTDTEIESVAGGQSFWDWVVSEAQMIGGQIIQAFYQQQISLPTNPHPNFDPSELISVNQNLAQTSAGWFVDSNNDGIFESSAYLNSTTNTVWVDTDRNGQFETLIATQP